MGCGWGHQFFSLVWELAARGEKESRSLFQAAYIVA